MMRLLHSPGRIPLFSEVGLLMLLAWIVSGWLLPEEKILPSGAMQASTGPAAVLPDLAGLLAVSLFGEAPVRIDPPKSVVKQAAPVIQSRLTIKLLGTVVAGEESAAIISTSAGSDQRVLFVGDIIQPGVMLHEIKPWAIVVDRAGKLEMVSLERRGKMTATPTFEHGEELNATPIPVKTPAGNPAVTSPEAFSGGR
jgi:general secretion pathway protein C